MKNNKEQAAKTIYLQLKEAVENCDSQLIKINGNEFKQETLRARREHLLDELHEVAETLV